MPRILLTGFFGIPGPTRAGVQMRHVMRALARHHEVDVLAVREPEQAHMERVGTARILRVPVAEDGLRPRVEAFRRALRRQIEGADYDVVHFRDGWSGSLVLELRAQHGYQAVFDATRAPVAEPPLMDLALSAELGRSEETCMAQADHVLVPSALARDHVLKRRSRGVHIVPAGVDVDLFDWDDLPPGPPMLLYAGAVEAGRGLRGLLRAMATVAQRSEANLVVAGRSAPAAARSLLATAAELGLRERVELRGEVAHESMPELIAQATVCVAPSAVELSAQPMAMVPTKILEYMACRRAVVAPRRGTVATVIEHGVSGMLFQPGDPADLGHKLLSLLHDPEARERLAGTGYHLVREYCTASAMRRALRRAYAAMQIRDTRPHQALLEVAGEIPGAVADAPAVRSRAGSVAAEIGESERTDQIPMPYPGLRSTTSDGSPGEVAQGGEGGEPTQTDLTELPPPARERARTGTRDTDPDPGPEAAPARAAVPAPAARAGSAAAPAPAVAPASAAAPAPAAGTEPAARDGSAAAAEPDGAPASAAASAPAAVSASGRVSGPESGPGGASGRRISSWDTFEMPALQTPPEPGATARAQATARDERDYRAVSGEVVVRGPAPRPGHASLDLEESYKAVSVLFGGSKDDDE